MSVYVIAAAPEMKVLDSVVVLCACFDHATLPLLRRSQTFAVKGVEGKSKLCSSGFPRC